MFISGLKCITKVHPRSKACACKAPLKKSLGHPSPGSWVSARPGRDMESLAGMWQLCIQVCRAPAGMRRQENQVLEARPSPESLKKRKKKNPIRNIFCVWRHKIRDSARTENGKCLGWVRAGDTSDPQGYGTGPLVAPCLRVLPSCPCPS